MWGSLSFWEQSFYLDVQKQIRQLYLMQYEEHLVSEKAREGAMSPTSPREASEFISCYMVDVLVALVQVDLVHFSSVVDV